mmetsp:Transcript_20383/g.57807  ORF Transcript_20383/g.57807 Transcript_20383/m.57807 type:complete len:287 (+) Transcript_20383:174-1034(+)
MFSSRQSPLFSAQHRLRGAASGRRRGEGDAAAALLEAPLGVLAIAPLRLVRVFSLERRLILFPDPDGARPAEGEVSVFLHFPEPLGAVPGRPLRLFQDVLSVVLLRIVQEVDVRARDMVCFLRAVNAADDGQHVAVGRGHFEDLVVDQDVFADRGTEGCSIVHQYFRVLRKESYWFSVLVHVRKRRHLTGFAVLVGGLLLALFADPAVVVVLVPLGPEILFRPIRRASRRGDERADERAAASHGGRRRAGARLAWEEGCPGRAAGPNRAPLYRTRPRAALCCDSVE